MNFKGFDKRNFSELQETKIDQTKLDIFLAKILYIIRCLNHN